MYVPKHFENKESSSVIDFIKSNGFGILVSENSGKLLATHIPLVIDDGGKKLHGHVARANAQWKNFDGQEVLAIFNGPHAYISSSWYNHENVSTWNYIAVHVYGNVRLIEDEELHQSLTELVDKYEKQSEKPVSVSGMSQDYLNRAIKGLVGFEISISKMEASYKLSQNRDLTNYEAIIRQLEKRNFQDDMRVADAMKSNKDAIKNKA